MREVIDTEIGELPNDVTLEKIGNCIELIIDHRGKTPKKMGGDWVIEGIKAISAKNVHDGKLSNQDEIRYVTYDVYKKWMKEDVKKGDCLIASEGATLGEHLYWDYDFPVVLGQRLFCIRTNSQILDPKYFYAYITSKYFQNQIHGRASGTSVFGLRQTEVLSMLVPIIPLQRQKSIGNFHYSINKKIDLLHRQNVTLEAMAETLFRQWFVEEEKEEWMDGTLDDLCNLFNGKSRPSEIGNIPIYGGNGILGYANVSNYCGKSIIIGRVGAYCGSLYYEDKEIWVSDNALLAKPKNEKFIHYLFYLLKTIDLNSMAEGSSHPLITQTLLKSIEINIPEETLIIHFYFLVEQFKKKIFANNIQIHSLITLRDTLLPKLMSGEIRVE